MIVYLSGSISGCLDTYKTKFAEAEKFCRELGYIVINPAVLPHGLEPDRYMPICLAMLDAADAIFMIKGWGESRGAALELAYAEYQGKLVIHDTREVEDGKTSDRNKQNKL